MVQVYFCAFYSFIDLCVCYCNSTMCLLFLWVCRLSEVWEDDTSNFILFPQDCFGSSDSYSSIWILGFSFLCCCRLAAKSFPALCDSMDWSMPGFPILHCLLEFSQTHVHLVSPSSHLILCHLLLLLPSNLSQHQGLCQWVSSSHHIAKVLEVQLQPLSFQWILRVDFL